MNISDYKIPQTDQECWEQYPKYNWVYNRTRLFEVQHILWSPFKTSICHNSLPIFTMLATDSIMYSTLNTDDNTYHTETIIQNGDLKWLCHFEHGEPLENIIGEIDLRINAFVTLYLQKFTGGVSFRTISNQISEIYLRPSYYQSTSYPEVATKLLKKVYKKKVSI